MMTLTKRCSVCGRFRHYHEEDRFCVVCGSESLDSACTCGRDYDYALEVGNEGTSLHCPKCGKSLKGRSADFE